MAGSGTTVDVCKLMLRRYRAYDLKPVRADIKKHDIKVGLPDETKGCNLIFVDPPYGDMNEADYRHPEGSLASPPETETGAAWQPANSDPARSRPAKAQNNLNIDTSLSPNEIDRDISTRRKGCQMQFVGLVFLLFLPVMRPIGVSEETGFVAYRGEGARAGFIGLDIQSGRLQRIHSVLGSHIDFEFVATFANFMQLQLDGRQQHFFSGHPGGCRRTNSLSANRRSNS